MKHLVGRRLSTRLTKGSALVIVMVLSAILLFVTISSFTTARYQARASDRSVAYQQALSLAEAGAETAMNELNKTSGSFSGSWTGSGSGYALDDTQLTAEGGDLIGTFKVEVADADTNSPVIRATGTATTAFGGPISRAVKVLAIKNLTPSPFGGFGIYSRGSITMNGGDDVDSYDSIDVDDGGNETIKQYNETYDDILNKSDEGNVGAKTTILMNGNNSVDGSIQAGSNITRNPVKGNPVSGQVIDHSSPTAPPDFPTEDYNAAKTNNDNENIQVIKGSGQASRSGTTVLFNGSNSRLIFPAPGTYYLTSLTLNGSGHNIEIDGTGVVKLYMNGNFNTNGANSINRDGSPTKFQVFSYSGDVTINGRNGAYMGVYTRNSNVTVNGNSPFYGAIVGQNITFNGNNPVHLDEGLLAASGSGGALARAWVEVRP